MDREANYAAVGLFVLLVAALAVAFVLWYSDTGDRREYARYEVYFNGSVSGLAHFSRRGTPNQLKAIGGVVDKRECRAL